MLNLFQHQHPFYSKSQSLKSNRIKSIFCSQWAAQKCFFYLFTGQYYNRVESENQPFSARPISLLLRTLCSLSAGRQRCIISLRGFLVIAGVCPPGCGVYDSVNVLVADYWEVSWFEHYRRGTDGSFLQQSKSDTSTSEGTSHSHHCGSLDEEIDVRLPAVRNWRFKRHVRPPLWSHFKHLKTSFFCTFFKRNSKKEVSPNGFSLPSQLSLLVHTESGNFN